MNHISGILISISQSYPVNGLLVSYCTEDGISLPKHVYFQKFVVFLKCFVSLVLLRTYSLALLMILIMIIVMMILTMIMIMGMVMIKIIIASINKK